MSDSHLVPFGGSFRVSRASSRPPKGAPSKDDCKAQLAEHVENIAEHQAKLYAQDQYSLLLIFQAMDAAGKDGTIRSVLTGVNPMGCQVSAFKAPSEEELDHDFLWRIYKALPERGRIGVFNRSHYEEVLAVRVHPELLAGQKLPSMPPLKKLWQQRYESIRNMEEHLARNGTVILKFWLHVSKEEQRRRLLERIDDTSSNWKSAIGDALDRKYWDKYMKAYQHALNETSRPWAPWYAIPADDKAYMRMAVARIVEQRLAKLNLKYPTVSGKRAEELKGAKALLRKRR